MTLLISRCSHVTVLKLTHSTHTIHWSTPSHRNICIYNVNNCKYALKHIRINYILLNPITNPSSLNPTSHIFLAMSQAIIPYGPSSQEAMSRSRFTSFKSLLRCKSVLFFAVDLHRVFRICYQRKGKLVGWLKEWKGGGSKKHIQKSPTKNSGGILDDSKCSIT